ncbi:MAG: Peptidase family [Fibrobacteres bacterium]|nr:Peptidase family [Fibrobacterota bacterium]
MDCFYINSMIQALILAASLISAAPKTAPADTSRAAPKPSLKANGADPVFDSTRAFRYLKEQCAMGPRDPEGEGHRRAIGYFTAHFNGLGLATVSQPFVHSDMATGKQVPLTNFIVTVPGRDPKRKPVLFCAHWDSRPRADQEASEMLSSRPILGANDGASGTAIVMELANLLQKKAPLQTVYLVLFDGEDYGREGSIDEYFLGARWFADNLPAPNLEYALLFDMVGDKDLHLPMEQNSMKQSPEITTKIWARAKSLGISQFESKLGPSVLDDHMPLQSKGVPAIDIIDFEYPAWHTQGDTPDKCSARSLGAVGRLAASLAFRGLP